MQPISFSPVKGLILALGLSIGLLNPAANYAALPSIAALKALPTKYKIILGAIGAVMLTAGKAAYDAEFGNDKVPTIPPLRENASPEEIWDHFYRYTISGQTETPERKGGTTVTKISDTVTEKKTHYEKLKAHGWAGRAITASKKGFYPALTALTTLLIFTNLTNSSGDLYKLLDSFFGLLLPSAPAAVN